MATTVTDVLRRALPAFLRGRPPLCEAQRRAVWAITHCRTRTMGGNVHACPDCSKKVFAYHSCNHRSCPLCGRSATARWVGRELAKRMDAVVQKNDLADESDDEDAPADAAKGAKTDDVTATVKLRNGRANRV